VATGVLAFAQTDALPLGLGAGLLISVPGERAFSPENALNCLAY